MPILFTGTQVCFEGVCTVEEAMPLLEFFRVTGSPDIDLSSCTYMHTALFQLLLIAKHKIGAMPADPFLSRLMAPLQEGLREQ